MLSKERIEALCTDGMYAGAYGDHDEWSALRELALKGLRTTHFYCADCDEFVREACSLSACTHKMAVANGPKELCPRHLVWWCDACGGPVQDADKPMKCPSGIHYDKVGP